MTSLSTTVSDVIQDQAADNVGGHSTPRDRAGNAGL